MSMFGAPAAPRSLAFSPLAAASGHLSGSPPTSCSTGTLVSGPSSSSRSSSGTPANSSDGHRHCHQQQHQHHNRQGLANMMGGHATGTAGPNAKEWLYRLVTFPAYFTPCLSCCSCSRIPKREQLMTLFDTKFPYKVSCSHCPESQLQQGAGSLLQVRRASFKDVVKATDICRFGADVAGVQQYTLNGSKVIYLNREQTQEKKSSNGAAAPASCTVDGRAMMDKASLYCSLKCKMQAEDAGFTSWLDTQDPSVRILADIAANAPPRPTVACKRAAQPSSSSGSDDSLAGSGGSTAAAGAAAKKARTSSGGTVGAAAGAPAAQGTGGESAAPAAAAGAASAPAAHTSTVRVPRQRAAPMQRAAPAPGAAAGGVSGTPAGLKPIKTSLAPSGNTAGRGLVNPSSRQGPAPSAFLEAAMKEPVLGPSTTTPAAAAGGAGTASQQQQPGISGSSWLPAALDLDNALSGTTIGSWESTISSWESGANSPSFGLGVDDWEEMDGSLSPALITAPMNGMGGAHGAQCVGSLGAGLDGWWMAGSPSGAFAGGLGAF